MRAKTLYLLAVLAVAVALFTTVPFRGLFEPDESRYALVAKGMLEEGHWLVPYLEGVPYTHKPPLYLWLVAALRGLGLPWTAAGVIPAFAAAMAVLLLFPRGGHRLGLSEEEAFLAAAATAACPLFVTMAVAARMDMLLTLALAASLVAAYVVVRGDGVSGAWRWVFWLGVGLGVMSKGPVAVALVALTLILFSLASREPLSFRNLFKGWAWAAPWVMILAWFVPAAASQGWGWVQEILIRQSAGRMVASFAHREPFYFHLITWPVTGFPGSLLALGAAVALWRRAQPPAVRFTASAFLAVLLFFSAISGKLVVYLLPLVPIAAVLAVLALRERAAWMSWVLAVSSLLGFALGGVIAAVPTWRSELGLTDGTAAVLGTGLVLPSLFGLVAAARREPGRAFRFLILAGVWFAAVVLPVATHHVDATLSVRVVARAYSSLASPGAPGLVYRETLSGLPVYGERPFIRLQTPEELERALISGRPVVVTERDWRKVRPNIKLENLKETRFPYRRSALLIVFHP
ncbi:MAG: glycosyltransferase family 39 protein [Thermoanaerobaculum sp.]